MNGRMRKGLMQATRAAFLCARSHHWRVHIGTPFTPVNGASGHDPETGRPIIPHEAYYTTTSS